MPDLALNRLIALVAFAGTYLGLALGHLPGFRVDRTGVAIIGAALMVVAGVIPWNEAVAAVDAQTLVLLFGMMIVAAYLRLSGFFNLVTAWAAHRARTPLGLLAIIVSASGALSALFVNDVICLVLAPLVLEITGHLRLPPTPYLIALATAANVGSVATLTGNPQNMLIGSFSNISYRSFLLREAPVAIVGLACVFAIVWLIYRRQLPESLPETDLRERFPVHYPLMIKTIVAVMVMLGAFLAGVPIALVAIGGAAYTLLTRRVKPKKVLTAVSALLSNLVSNVPAVLLFRSLIPTFGEPTRAWLLLAMASTLAGNLTILGSVANLIVVEAAREAHVEIGFVEYCKVGIPLTLLTLLLGWLILSFVPV